MLPAQKNSLNVVFGGGASYFLTDKSINRRVDPCVFLGANMILNKKNRLFYFNPGINFSRNHYSSKLKHNGRVDAVQVGRNITLDVLMKINKNTFMKMGLYFCYISRTDIGVSYKDPNFYYSNSDMHEGYNVNKLQTGICTGLCLPFSLFKQNFTFDMIIQHLASRLVNEDYYFTHTLNGESVKVLSVNSIPTKLLFALELELKKRKKKKSEEGVD